MTIEISLLLTGVSVAFAVFFGLKSARKADVDDITAKAKDSAIVNTKLDMISTDVRDIKLDISGVKKEVQDINEKYILIDQSVKSAHHRLDTLENRVIGGATTHERNSRE